MTHLAYVTAAYLAAVLGIGGLIVWIVIDHRSAKRTLARLEAGGVTRRSARSRTP